MTPLTIEQLTSRFSQHLLRSALCFSQNHASEFVFLFQANCEEVAMPPYAICSDPNCPFVFDMQEEKEGNTRVPPATCPKCVSLVVFHCPLCHLAIFHEPPEQDPRCEFCRARLRQWSLRGMAGSVQASTHGKQHSLFLSDETEARLVGRPDLNLRSVRLPRKHYCQPLLSGRGAVGVFRAPPAAAHVDSQALDLLVQRRKRD